MKISIIVPVYNAEDYLEACVGSVLKQNLKDFELILVDDGSGDGSLEICREYAAVDERVRVISKNNGGVSSARNAGMSLASGEYVMFLDSDDMLEEEALSVFYENAAGADLVVAESSVYEDGRFKFLISPQVEGFYGPDDMVSFLELSLQRSRRCLDSPWCKMFRRQVLVRTGLRFDERLSYAEDKLFVYSYLLECRSVASVRKSLYRYFIRSGSLGSDRSSDRHLVQLREFLGEYSCVLKRLAAVYDMSETVSLHYHRDLVGTYVCRILNVFASRKTELLSESYIAFLYALMAEDSMLRPFSLRTGQVFNVLLYMIGNPRLSVAIYRFTSSMTSCIR